MFQPSGFFRQEITNQVCHFEDNIAYYMYVDRVINPINTVCRPSVVQEIRNILSDSFTDSFAAGLLSLLLSMMTRGQGAILR